MIVQSRTCEKCRYPIASKGLLHIRRFTHVLLLNPEGIIPIIFTIFSRSAVFIIELDGCKSLIASDGNTLSLKIIF